MTQFRAGNRVIDFNGTRYFLSERQAKAVTLLKQRGPMTEAALGKAIAPRNNKARESTFALVHLFRKTACEALWGADALLHTRRGIAFLVEQKRTD